MTVSDLRNVFDERDAEFDVGEIVEIVQPDDYTRRRQDEHDDGGEPDGAQENDRPAEKTLASRLTITIEHNVKYIMTKNRNVQNSKKF